MAIPKPEPSDWQKANAQVLRATDREVLAMLRDSYGVVQKELRALIASEATNLSAGIRRAQLEASRSRLMAEQAKVFERLGDIVSARRLRAASRAARLSVAADAALLKLVGKGETAQILYEAALNASGRAIEAAMARLGGPRAPLSQRIYQTRLWMDGRLGRLINATLASGINAKTFAKTARDWFNPSTPGGVRYAALRLARTEINNAFHAISVQKAADKPWVGEMDWHLSKSHPKPDKCNVLADASPYPADNVPMRPHPQCMCYVTEKTIGEDEWIDRFMEGEFDDYLDGELEKAGVQSEAVDKPEPVRAAEPTSLKPLNVLSPLDAVFAQDWQKQADPEKRAAGLWSESFFGLEAVRNGMRNVREGKDPLEGLDLRRGRLDIFRDHIGRDDDESAPLLYSEEDFRNDVRNAAQTWETKLQKARAGKKILYRGIRMDSSKIYKVGDTFKQDVSSWTEDRGWALVYANTQDASTGHIGDAEVIVKMTGPKHTVNIDPLLGSAMRGSKEHIGRGEYRVVSVTNKGNLYTVEVEEIGNE